MRGNLNDSHLLFPGCFTRPPGTSTRNHPHESTTSKPVVPGDEYPSIAAGTGPPGGEESAKTGHEEQVAIPTIGRDGREHEVAAGAVGHAADAGGEPASAAARAAAPVGDPGPHLGHRCGGPRAAGQVQDGL